MTSLNEDDSRHASLQHGNRIFANLAAADRVAWSLEHLPDTQIVSSSFGAQAAVTLSLVTKQRPDIPVVLIDTGYLFPETYRFIDELTDRLGLTLHVYQAPISPAWQEARFGRRWEQGLNGLENYNDLVKVEPMKRALEDLNVGTWFAGLRRSQASSRANTPYLDWSGDRWKVHPIADWTDRDVHRYLKKNRLPYHPLWDEGYVSIGDHHSTRPIHAVNHVDETRFMGQKRECGLHEFDFSVT